MAPVWMGAGLTRAVALKISIEAWERLIPRIADPKGVELAKKHLDRERKALAKLTR